MFDSASDYFSDPSGSLTIGMDTIVKHFITIIGIKRVKVYHFETILLGNLLLDGNNTVNYNRIVDIPCRLESGNRSTEKNLRTTLCGTTPFFLDFFTG